MQTFYGHGKLLLTGEYSVLDGALALAIPTRFGQKLIVEDSRDGQFNWQSVDVEGQTWFAATFHLKKELGITVKTGSSTAGERLIQVLSTAIEMRPDALEVFRGKSVTTILEFNREWGLGSSSTLLYCLAEWLKIDAYTLLKKTFGGSGYDLACAGNDTAITYQINQDIPIITPLRWSPAWVRQTYFVYQNQKQNSRAGIQKYRRQDKNIKGISRISEITATLSTTLLLAEAQKLLQDHENITSQLVSLPTIKEELFPDFNGVVKSLGAWGGDFCWVISDQNEQEIRNYFSEKGFETMLSWEQMVF